MRNTTPEAIDDDRYRPSNRCPHAGRALRRGLESAGPRRDQGARRRGRGQADLPGLDEHAAPAGRRVMETATRNGATTEERDAAAAWVEMFAEGWANPVDTDTFCDHFDPWFQPEVRMIQPSVRPVVGK